MPVATGRGKLGGGQRRLLVLLALPAFGVSLAYTLVTTYLPLFVHRLSGPIATGAMIGGEGVLALVLPVLVGGWSDSLRTRLGSRLPFVLLGAALAVVGLLLVPVWAGSLAGIGAALGLFFFGYFFYYSPYYALYPDLVPDAARGRSQGVQGAARSAGMLLALAGGGFALALWRPLPFLVGAVAVAAVTAVFVLGVRGTTEREKGGESAGSAFAAVRNLARSNRDIRDWMIANSMWEAAIAALKTFVILYVTRGLGLSLGGASGALGLVGLAALVAAPVGGWLADRRGHRPVMLAAVVLFGLGLLVPLFTADPHFVAAVVPVTFSAVVLNVLPYSMLMGIMPERHGVGASLFGFSRGVGVLVGPLLAGVAVAGLRSVDFLVFEETEGFSAVFAVAAAFMLLSVPFLRRIGTARDEPHKESA